MKTTWYSTLFLIFLCVGCNTVAVDTTVVITETAGLDRDVEYVTTTLAFKERLRANEMLLATDIESGQSIDIQVTDSIKTNNEFELSVLFPVSIAANQTKKFKVSVAPKKQNALATQLLFSKDTHSIESSDYKIHFSVEYDKRGGQVNGIELKKLDNIRLKRGHISMHWAPNFSKSTSENYYNMEDLPPSSENIIAHERYRVVKKRSGSIDSVPEIHLEGRYEFYADVPYFLFESTMKMKNKVELDLLRNDEMTMDSLFTHVAYPKKDGSVVRLNLYSDSLAVLEENPIRDDAAWVAFYNQDKGYGFGSIRLNYDNTNVNGEISPTHKPYTKITRSTGNGRYWNRVLTDTIKTFPKGSQYYEKNAYLIFKVADEFPEKELLQYNTRLRSPLKVVIQQEY